LDKIDPRAGSGEFGNDAPPPFDIASFFDSLA
jgi:hypothetical protein